MEHMHLEEQEKAALAFLSKAASVYQPRPRKEDIVLEVFFTDIQKTYQMVLEQDSCTILTDNFKPFTVRAEATYSVFEDLAKGRKSPAIAILKGHVKTKGDLRVLNKLEKYFPGLEAMN